jgi:hypothetical protein
MFKPWAPIISGIAVIVVGLFIFTHLHLHGVFPHSDKFFHTLGGIVIAWYFSLLWKDKLTTFTHVERLIIYIAMAAMVGFLWELLEYSTAQYPLDGLGVLRHYVFGGNLRDTLGDLTADLFGASIFGLLKK